jgi:hypothetical protein
LSISITPIKNEFELVAARLSYYSQRTVTSEDVIRFHSDDDNSLLLVKDDNEIVGALFGKWLSTTYDIVDSYLELNIWNEEGKALEAFRVARAWFKEHGIINVKVISCARQLMAMRICDNVGVKTKKYIPGSETVDGLPRMEMEWVL